MSTNQSLQPPLSPTSPLEFTDDTCSDGTEVPPPSPPSLHQLPLHGVAFDERGFLTTTATQQQQLQLFALPLQEEDTTTSTIIIASNLHYHHNQQQPLQLQHQQSLTSNNNNFSTTPGNNNNNNVVPHDNDDDEWLTSFKSNPNLECSGDDDEDDDDVCTVLSSRSTVIAYAASSNNSNNPGDSSFIGSSDAGSMLEGAALVGGTDEENDTNYNEGKNGRFSRHREKEEVSHVGGSGSARLSQKQAKRERRQKAKAGDAEGAFAGSMSHSALEGGTLEEILPPPAPGTTTVSSSCRHASNDWLAPLINLMGGLQSEEQSPNNVSKKAPSNNNNILTPSNKRNDLRSGKRNLMSSWCNNVHTQQKDSNISNWIDHVPNTSPHGVFSPPSSSVVSPSPSVGDNDVSLSLLSDSSSFVRGLRGAIGSSRAESVHGGSSSASTVVGATGDEGVAAKVGEALVLVPSSPVASPHASTTLPSTRNGNATLPPYAHLNRHHHPITTSATSPRRGGGPIQQHHPTTTTTTSTRLRDAINAVQKYRVSGVDTDESDTSANSMNSVSIVISTATRQGEGCLYDDGDVEHECSKPEDPNTILQQNVSQLHSSSSIINNINVAVQKLGLSPDTSQQPNASSSSFVVVEGDASCSFGIRTQPIPKPKRTNRKSAVSTVSLNECVYNLDNWDEDEYGWFVVPTDNIADFKVGIALCGSGGGVLGNNSCIPVLEHSHTEGADIPPPATLLPTHSLIAVRNMEKAQHNDNLFSRDEDNHSEQQQQCGGGAPRSISGVGIPLSSYTTTTTTTTVLAAASLDIPVYEEGECETRNNTCGFSVSMHDDDGVHCHLQTSSSHQSLLIQESLSAAPLATTHPSSNHTTATASKKSMETSLTYVPKTQPMMNDTNNFTPTPTAPNTTTTTTTTAIASNKITSGPESSISVLNSSFPLNFQLLSPINNSVLSTSVPRSPNLFGGGSSTTMRSASDVLAAFFSSTSIGRGGGVTLTNSSSGGGSAAAVVVESSPTLSRYKSVVMSSDSSAGCILPSDIEFEGHQQGGMRGGDGMQSNSSPTIIHNITRKYNNAILSPSTPFFSQSSVIDDEDATATTNQHHQYEEQLHIHQKHANNVHRQFISSMSSIRRQRQVSCAGSPILLIDSLQGISGGSWRSEGHTHQNGCLILYSTGIRRQRQVSCVGSGGGNSGDAINTTSCSVHVSGSYYLLDDNNNATFDAVPSGSTSFPMVATSMSRTPSEMYYFSDVVANYNVTVDTLTHGASNHTLQLAQPLTGDSARNYRRNEARMQHPTLAHQQQLSEQED